MMNNLNTQPLDEIARRQYGYFSARQAVEAGYTKQLQYYHVKHGNWVKVVRAVYRLNGFADTACSEFAKWSLWTTSHSGQVVGVISHESALAYFGLSASQPMKTHLTVPMTWARAEEAGCILHRDSVLPEERQEERGFTVTTPMRTLLDMKPDLVLRKQWIETVLLAQQKNWITALMASTLLSGYAMQDISASLVTTGKGQAMGSSRPELAQVPANAATDSAIRRPSIPPRLRMRGVFGDRSAFTLVELLVVISIISVLAAMLLPALQKASELSRFSFCSNNMRQVGIAQLSYVEDNNGYLSAVVTDTSTYSDYWDYTRIWDMVYSQPWGQARFEKSIFACPTYMQLKPGANTSYAFNGWFPTGSFTALQPQKLSMATAPTKCLMIGEGPNHHINGWFNIIPPGQPALFNHMGKMNIIYMDGHADARFAVEIPTATTSVFWKGR